MSSVWRNFILLFVGLFIATSAQAAVDSYRFAHVTISTPWYIFIFLLMGVFIPFVLMAILSWRVAMQKNHPEDNVVENKSPNE